MFPPFNQPSERVFQEFVHLERGTISPETWNVTPIAPLLTKGIGNDPKISTFIGDAIRLTGIHARAILRTCNCREEGDIIRMVLVKCKTGIGYMNDPQEVADAVFNRISQTEPETQPRSQVLSFRNPLNYEQFQILDDQTIVINNSANYLHNPNWVASGQTQPTIDTTPQLAFATIGKSNLDSVIRMNASFMDYHYSTLGPRFYFLITSANEDVTDVQLNFNLKFSLV